MTAANTPEQPKKFDFYLVNDDSLERLKILASECCHSIEDEQEVEDIMQEIRSRPHPAPQAPAFKRCCDSCINVPCKVLDRVPCLAQEKQENICEENGCTDIGNCDEICQHSRLFSSLQMQEAKEEAARKAREDVLDEIARHGNYLSLNALSHEDWIKEIKKYIHSLRHPSEQQEQPR